jgi:hypothetical protein
VSGALTVKFTAPQAHFPVFVFEIVIELSP